MNSFEIKTLLFIGIIVAVVLVIKFLSPSKENKLPYVLKTSWLTKGETKILEGIAEAGYFPFPKVRILDFVKYEYGRKIPIQYLSQVSSRSVDFLVCDTETFSPVAIVMCSPNDFVKRLSEKLGIPFIVIQKNTSLEEAKRIVLAEIQGEKNE